MTGTDFVDRLAQEIRRVDGENKLGAGALAEAICSFMQGESLRLFNLLYDIRQAAGDPEGRLMQEELVEKISEQTSEIAQLETCLETWEQAHNRLRSQVISVRDLMFKWRNEGQEDKADELQEALGKGGKP